MQKKVWEYAALNRHEIAHPIKAVDRLTVCAVPHKSPYGYRRAHTGLEKISEIVFIFSYISIYYWWVQAKLAQAIALAEVF